YRIAPLEWARLGDARQIHRNGAKTKIDSPRPATRRYNMADDPGLPCVFHANRTKSPKHDRVRLRSEKISPPFGVQSRPEKFPAHRWRSSTRAIHRTGRVA